MGCKRSLIQVIINKWKPETVPLEDDPTILYIYKVGCKSQGFEDKNPQKKAGNSWVGFNSPTGRDPCRGVGMFCTDWS